MKEVKRGLESMTDGVGLKFTRGHEILMTGLIGAGMNYRDIFHLEMGLITEKEALDLAAWILDEFDKRNNLFPLPEEIVRQAKKMFPQNDFSSLAMDNE
jgi:hypothetical protein